MRVMLSRWILIVFLLIPTACSSGTQTPTVAPTAAPAENPPTAESTATVQSNTETPVASTTPGAANTEVSSSPTEAVSLFTASDGTYTVNLTLADFVEEVDNPYFPLPPGAKWVFEIRQGNKTPQTDTLEVQQEKREVNGVQATMSCGIRSRLGIRFWKIPTTGSRRTSMGTSGMWVKRWITTWPACWSITPVPGNGAWTAPSPASSCGLTPPRI